MKSSDRWLLYRKLNQVRKKRNFCSTSNFSHYKKLFTSGNSRTHFDLSNTFVGTTRSSSKHPSNM